MTVLGLLVATLGLAGCETVGNVFSNGPDTDSQPSAQVAQAPKAPLAKVTLAPIVGAPDAVGKQLTSQFEQAADRNRVGIVGAEGKADYSLRGYIVAARDKGGSKVSYIWDVFDQSGKRVNRISGEEMAPGQPNAKDPWASVSAAITQTIADKSAASLAAWLPSRAGQAQTPVAAAQPAGQAQPAAAGAGSIAPPAQQSAARAPQTTNTTTAALPRSDQVAAVVPPVTGAPGDGNAALSAALQRELSRQGVELANRPGSTYRVEGRVVLGQTKDGKQPIQIDWQVKDPQGKSLGTVSQKNEIPPGSLDGEWGKTADAAAAAAAQGIVKLLPQSKAVN
jgi:hypothetical protein